MQLVKKSVGYALLVLPAVLLVSAYLLRQDIIDWWRLRDYEPSPAIAQLSVGAGFSDLGEKLFYVHDPSLLDKSSFQGKCGDNEETIVLGCYITNQKIYVFDVEDERLEGIEEVTAAHEMLHAAYDRLSESEREELTIQLTEVFESLNDKRLNETIETYAKRDPSVVPNELHSILPTEVRNLPSDLEEYYSQYFTDRLKVVGLAEAYEDEFTKRQDQIKSYDEQLQSLEAQINSLELQVDQLNIQLTQERRELESKRGNPEEFNALVPGYNAKVQTYNTQIQTLKETISAFNEIVELRNAIAIEEQDLVEAIDTRIDTL